MRSAPQATALVLPLERFSEPAAAEPAWRALEAFLADATGCRAAHASPPQVFAKVAALLNSSRHADAHASSLDAVDRARRAALARQLDRKHLGGWYARLGEALGYDDEGHDRSVRHPTVGASALRDEVRALCLGRHADAAWL